MGAKFNRVKNPLLDSELSSTTPDLVKGDRTTAVIGGKNTKSLYYHNFRTSELPSFGSGELDSFEFKINTKSITYADKRALPKLEMHLLDTKASTEGALISSVFKTDHDTDYLVYSWHPSGNHVNLVESLQNHTLRDTFYTHNQLERTQEYTKGFITVEDAEEHLVNYSVEEANVYAHLIKDENLNFIGYEVSYETGYCDASDGATGVVIDGYGTSSVSPAECYTNSMGVYLTDGYSNGTKRSPPPRGRMYLDNTVTHDSAKIKYNHTTFAESEGTQLIAASTQDTSIFNHFESTRDFFYAEGTSGSSNLPTNAVGQIEGAVATVVLEQGKSISNNQSLRLRTYQKKYANGLEDYSFQDGASLTNRQYVRLDALDIPSPVVLNGGITLTKTNAAYNDDPTITLSGGITTANLEVGDFVDGTGIPDGATISSITSDTVFELSASTTGGSESGQTLTFFRTQEGSSVSQTMEVKLCIPKMAPQLKYSGISQAHAKADVLAVTSKTAGSGGVVEVQFDLDDTTFDFTTVTRNFLSDELQYLVGRLCHVDGSASDLYIVRGVVAGDKLALSRVGHSNNPAGGNTINFETRTHAQHTSERGLFFIMSEETIAQGLSHTGALLKHGRRENQDNTPTSYTCPSMLEWGIVYDPALESTTTNAKFKIVTGGRLFKMSEHLDTSTALIARENGGDEFMVDYNGQARYSESQQPTEEGTLIADSPRGSSDFLGILDVDFDEWFTMIVEFNVADEDVNLFFVNNNGDNLLVNSNDSVKVFNEKSSVLNYKEPTAAASKWPKNLYVYLNNTKDFRNSGTSSETQVESDYWLTYDDSGDDANTDAATESIVNIDSIVFNRFWPNTVNSTLHTNNIAQGPIVIKQGNVPAFYTSDEWKDKTDTSQDVYICLGHQTATSLSGDNSYVSMFFDGFSKGMTGTDASVELTAANISGFGATTNEPLGLQLGYPALTNGFNGYAVTSFDNDASFGTDNFKHKGAGVLRWNTSAAGTYPHNVGVQVAREHILASAKVIKILDDRSIVVDSPNKLQVDYGKDTTINQRFILYRYGKAYDDEHYRDDLIIESIKGNIVRFTADIKANTNTDSNQFTTDTDTHNLFVSPKAHWVTLRVTPQEERSYSSTYRIPSDNNSADFTPGVTYNEFLYNDGPNINSWNLLLAPNTNLITDVDFGFGSFETGEDADPLKTGHVSSKWAETGYNTFKMSKQILDATSSELGATIPNVIQPRTFTDAAVEVYTGDDFTLTERASYNNDPTITVTSTDNLFVGMLVSGTGIPTGATVASITSSTEFELSASTTGGSLTSQTLTFTNPNKPLCVTVFEDALPKIEDFKIQPNKDDPFNIDFTWTCQDEDTWYGFLIVNESNIENQYKGSIIHLPFNEEGDHDTDASNNLIDNVGGFGVSAGGGTASKAPHYNMEGLAGNCLDFDGSTHFVSVGGSGSDVFSSIAGEFSVVVHINHDDATVGSDGEYIIKKEGFNLFIDQNEQVVANLYSDSDSAITLKSASKVTAGIPMNIIVTLDSALTSGNAKLFIDGKLEDLSGDVLTSHGNDLVQTGWVKDTDLHSANGTLFIGNETASASKAFDGKIEEIVFYNSIIYPVDVKSGKFTFTKPLKELNDVDNASSKSYSARLFVKDYHNIRGKTVREVATTAPVFFRKPAFRLNYS